MSAQTTTYCRSQRKGRHRRLHSGVTFIEVLAAALVSVICLAALVGMWYFSYGMAFQTDSSTVAYLVGRRGMEVVKRSGFKDSPEGDQYFYYDNQGEREATTKAAHHSYKLHINISTNPTFTGTTPPDTSLRTVTIRVYATQNNQELYRSATYLARAGI